MSWMERAHIFYKMPSHFFVYLYIIWTNLIDDLGILYLLVACHQIISMRTPTGQNTAINFKFKKSAFRFNKRALSYWIYLEKENATIKAKYSLAFDALIFWWKWWNTPFSQFSLYFCLSYIHTLQKHSDILKTSLKFKLMHTWLKHEVSYSLEGTYIHHFSTTSTISL